MTVTVRQARPEEYTELGNLLASVYAALPGFPSPERNPSYYRTLRQVGELAEKPGVEVLVACGNAGELLGGVVYFGDLAYYGAGDFSDSLTNWAGFRFLGVSPQARGTGAGRALTGACLNLAREQGKAGMILHTTETMPVAWAMYERLGFVRAAALDLGTAALPIYGFRLPFLPAD